jgi:hypothetical protein
MTHTLKNIGFVSDFRNYKAYFDKFSKKYGCNALEIHFLDRDFPDLEVKLDELREFVKHHKIHHLSFHSSDMMVQNVVFEDNPERLDSDKENFYKSLDLLMKLGKALDKDIIYVIHEGLKLPSSDIAKMSHEEVDQLRKKYLDTAKKKYAQLIDYTKGSRLIVALESSPPICGSVDSQHFIDLAFEDFVPRLGDSGKFIFDFSHIMICIQYFKQHSIKFEALESLRREHGRIPDSMQSMENYIKMSAKNIVWLHISDTNGILGVNEGLPIGAEDSNLDFHEILSLFKKYDVPLVGVLELVDSHKDYSIIEKSMDKLIELWDGNGK